MSRTTDRARSSFYRAGGLPRVASMIALLIVIAMLMARAADPSSWIWLTGEREGGNSPTSPTALREQVNPEPIAPGLTDKDPEEREAAAEQFQAISDRTIELAREEMPAYWRLFDWVEHQSLDDLARRADRTAVLNQFLQTPDEQRGKLFQLELNVRRVLPYDAPANSAGIKKVYEIWGWTTESKAWLYVVLTAHLPSGMPLGADVNERVTFVGYFLKVQGYQAAGAGPRDKPLAAPLLIGRMAWKSPPATASASHDARWEQQLFTFMLLLVAIGLGIWLFVPRRAGAKRIAGNLSEGPSPGGDLRNWLADMERGSANAETGNGDFHIQDDQRRNRRETL